MLLASNYLAEFKTKPTIETAKNITRFLNRCASHPGVVMEYRRSNMILYLHSDYSYLSEPEAHSRSGGCLFLGPGPAKQISAVPQANYPKHVE